MMVNEETIQTQHPDPDQAGREISRAKYDMIHDSILALLRRKGPLPHLQLIEAVEKDVDGRFEGPVGWYAETVNLDLEARGVIERVNYRGRERLRLTSASE